MHWRGQPLALGPSRPHTHAPPQRPPPTHQPTRARVHARGGSGAQGRPRARGARACGGRPVLLSHQSTWVCGPHAWGQTGPAVGLFRRSRGQPAEDQAGPDSPLWGARWLDGFGDDGVPAGSPPSTIPTKTLGFGATHAGAEPAQPRKEYGAASSHWHYSSGPRPHHVWGASRLDEIRARGGAKGLGSACR